jgi:transposase
MKHQISEELWERIEPLLPRMKKRRGYSGRNPRGWREVLEGIFWILRTGSQWSELPERYPPKSTVHDRFQLLVREGFFESLAFDLSAELLEAGVIDLEECFIDGMFIPAKKGAKISGRRNEEKARK